MRIQQKSLSSFCFLAVLLAAFPMFAQDETEPDKRAVTEVPEIKAEVSEDGERIIYVPFKDFEGTFNSPDSNVVLPYAEYQQMLEAWKLRNEPPLSPSAVINSADYVVKIDGDLARISATLKLSVLGKPWVWILVKFGDASISKVSGDNVLLQGVGQGEYKLFFDSVGEKTVQLELALPVNQSPDGREFTLSVPAVGVSTLDITIPKPDQTITATPTIVELPVEGLEADANQTRIKANVGATQQIRVQWHPKTTLKPEMNLLASVNNQTLVNIEDGLVHTDTWLHYEILRGSMEQCRVVVPLNHRILDVTASARIKSWNVKEQDDNQIVDIVFLSAVENPVTIETHTEYKLADNGICEIAGWDSQNPTKGIHALDVVRESGQIAVRHSGDYAVNVQEQRGVVRIEQNEVAEKLRGNNRLTFKFYSPDLSLGLNAQPVQPRLMVSQQVRYTFDNDELKVHNQLGLTVEKAGVFAVLLKIPAGLKVDTVQSPHMKEYNFDEATGELTVTLNERTLGGINLSVQSHLELEDGTALSLPMIEPLNVERETGTVLVYSKDSLEVITDQESLEGLQPLPIGQQRQGDFSLNSAWSFHRRPVSITVTTKRKPTRLTSNVATTVDVQPELTKVRTQLDYLVEYAGIDTFRFEVPAEISDDISIETAPGDQASAPIKQRSASDAMNGWVTWTVLTQREIMGRQRFIISYDVSGSSTSDSTEESVSDEEGNSNTINLIRPLGLIDEEGGPTTELARMSGEVVVQKERSLSLSVEADGAGVELIDLRELQFLPQTGTLAYRYFLSDAENRPVLTIHQSRHEIQEVVSTIITRGLVEIVTGEDSEATYRCRFHVKTTERQRLLVFLPVNLEILGTFLNDREIRLEKADDQTSDELGESWTPFWLNVARTESSDQPFLLTFQFLWKVNPTLGESTFGRGRMALPLPLIGEGVDSVVQELKVAVWVPEKYSLVGDPADFELQTEFRPESLLLGERADRAANQLNDWVCGKLSTPAGVGQFPTEGRVPYIYTNLGGAEQINVMWWNQVMITMIASLAIGLIAWILMRTSWENKLGMLLIATFAAALYGLKDSHALQQGIYAARFGILLLIALWLLHGLFQCIEFCKANFRFPQPALATATGASPSASEIETTITESSEPGSESSPPES